METWKLVLSVIAIIVAPLIVNLIKTRFALASSRSEGGLELEKVERKAADRGIRDRCVLTHERVDEHVEDLKTSQKEVKEAVACVDDKIGKLLARRCPAKPETSCLNGADKQ